MNAPAVWFPTLRAGTGADAFTEALAAQLRKRGVRAEITWLPLRAEYAPWTVPIPTPPAWANVAHVNTWLHPRFIPKHLSIVATIHHSMHHPDLRLYKSFARVAYHRCWIAPNERRVLRRADRITAVSEFAAETARRTLLDRPMEVIHNGVDTERFRPPPQRTAHKPFRLLYVGKWAPLKGVDMLAPIMRELGSGFELHYTGGPAADRDRQDMPANMHDIGRLRGADAVIAAMQDADAFLFASRSEGFPLVVIEAMACGLPVIATRGSSLSEAVVDGVAGILCRQDDMVAFASACSRMGDGRGLHESALHAARVRAVECFSANKMVDAYERIYANCLHAV